MREFEINGIKLEVDERTARTVEQYRVGDPVKVLKKSYGDNYDIYPGVIVGFCDFRELPSIEVMYLKGGSWETEAFELGVLNAKTTDIDIAPMNDMDVMFERESVLEKFDAAIQKGKDRIAELEMKRHYFETRFAAAFEAVEAKT